ncbi:MAG: hypothetical protein J7L15_09175 [Clostridiales bacterium]|nr:hypothetical protein [Clostridiales bacterium]
MKTLVDNKRGQVTIYGIIIVTVMLVIFVALLPVIISAINIVYSNPDVDQLTKLAISAIPVTMAASIMLVLMVYIGGR